MLHFYLPTILDSNYLDKILLLNYRGELTTGVLNNFLSKRQFTSLSNNFRATNRFKDDVQTKPNVEISKAECKSFGTLCTNSFCKVRSASRYHSFMNFDCNLQKPVKSIRVSFWVKCFLKNTACKKYLCWRIWIGAISWKSSPGIFLRIT